MKFKEFSEYLERLEETSSRIKITSILTELLGKLTLSEIDKAIYLSLGVLAPNYEGVILNLAEKMMLKVLSNAYSKPLDEIKTLYKKLGDIGDTAEGSSKASKVADKNLGVEDVYSRLLGIAKDTGGGSQERKIEKMAGLLREIDSLSARFIARIPVGRLRLGFSEKTIIAALAAQDLRLEKEIENAYNVRPDIGYIAKLTRERKLEDVIPKIGVPVVPMLAARLNSPSEMIKKMGEVSVEPKFDGLRIFIHYRRKDSFLRIFTRNMNSIPVETFPELKEVGKFIKADEVILDTEAVGVDPKREMFLDFQKTIQRRRKHEVEKSASEVPLQFQVFDILYRDGKNYINSPYVERRKVIEKTIVNGKLLKVDENTITKDPEVIRKKHQEYLKMGLEGVIVKKANAGYVSGRTGWNWVKMKEVEGKRGKLADTVDCVIMGFTSGKGKRVGFGVGQFLAGIKDGDVFETVTKVGTGLTDEQFRELNRRLEKIKILNMPKEYRVNKDLYPDFWVDPKVVVELAADEVTISPKHTAGLALRFPRLVRFRDDRSPRDATDVAELKTLFELQKSGS